MARTHGTIDSAITEICTRHAVHDGPLLPILHDVQARYGYISDAAIQQIANELNLSRAEVFGVVTFYHDFHRQPQRTHELRVCRAEACQSVGGREVWNAATRAAENGRGDVQLQSVYCLGNCACAPSVQLDGHTIGRMSPERVTAMLSAGSLTGAPS